MPAKLTPAGPSTTRIETLSDGVFAIAMTVMVLNLRIPEIPSERLAGELRGSLQALWPSLISYFLSFSVLGIYWVAHHLMFHYIERADRMLLWMTVYYLMLISLVPFSTSLLGRYGHRQTPVVIYGLHLLAIGLLALVQWWYACAGRRLVPANLPVKVMRHAAIRLSVIPLAALFSIAGSFVEPRLSLFLYLIVLFAYGLVPRTQLPGKESI